jgi:ribose transport system ATP-binding protein
LGNILLEARNISKSFYNNLVLDNICFECGDSEVHAIVGENGAGKSTLMKILSGVYLPTSGEICMGGQKTVINNIVDAQKLGITIIHQEFNLIPYLTVAENIFLGRQPLKGRFIDYNLMNEKVKEMCNKLKIFINHESLVEDLTVAQQQMVEIMKALNIDAKIIIMDEPTAALSSVEVKALFDIINTLKAENKTIIFISHRLNEVFEIADRITVIKDGVKIGTENIEKCTKEKIVSMMVGREIDNIFPPRLQKEKGELVLEVEDIKVKTQQKVGASFKAYAGEILSITGLEGQGQREIIRSLFGLHRPISGKVKLYGKYVNIKKPKIAIKNGITFLSDDRKMEGLCLTLSIIQNVPFPIINKIKKFIFLTTRMEKAETKKRISSLDLRAASLNLTAEELSGGNQQKVALARCLSVDPKIIVVHEPTRGVDVAAKIEIYKLLRRLAESGAAVIMVSSDLLEVINISDRVMVVYSGEIKGEIGHEDVTEENIMTLATGIA